MRLVYNGTMGNKKKVKTQTAYLPIFLKTLVIVLLVGISMLLVFAFIQNKDQAIAGLAKKEQPPNGGRI